MVNLALSNLNEGKLIYIIPEFYDTSLLSKINGLCINYKEAGFNQDELEEFVDICNLLSKKVSSLYIWLEITSHYKSYLVTSRSTIRYRLALENVIKELFKNETENCPYLSSPLNPWNINEVKSIKTLGYINLSRSKDGEPIIVQNQLNERFILGELFETPDLIPQSTITRCLFKIPPNFDHNDFLTLRIDMLGIPVLILGLRLEREDAFETFHFEVSKNLEYLVVFATLTLPEQFRKSQTFQTSHLYHICWKAKQGLLETLPLSKWTPVRQKDYAIYWTKLQNCKNESDLIEWIKELEKNFQIWNPSSAKIEHPLDVWMSENISLPSFLALICHFLLRLAWNNQPEWLIQSRVNIVLLGNDSNKFKDEGSALSLELEAPNGRIVLFGDTKIIDQVKISEARLSFIIPASTQQKIETTTSIIKHVPAKQISSNEVSSPLCSLAIISIGQLDYHIRSLIQDTVAGIIELEDRHVRVSNLPEPWQYNLLKIMDNIASNPNIRSLLILGPIQNASVSTAYLRKIVEAKGINNLISNTLALPETYFPIELVKHIANQVEFISVYSQDPNNLEAVTKFTINTIINSYNEIFETEIQEQSCYSEAYIQSDLAKESIGIQEETISKLSKGIDSKNLLSGVTGITVQDVYPKVVWAVLSLGEMTSVKDKAGRLYKELSSYKITIQDPYITPIPLGFETPALEKHFQEEWIGENGRFFERMTKSFTQPNSAETVDQFAGTISEIKQAILDEYVSRRIILSVYHPLLDKKDILSLNTIHFNVSRNEHDPNLWFLHSSTVMRTVDVLFGLPYDIYSICRFSQYVAEKVNKLIAPFNQRVLAKTVSMVALNLHLYADPLNYKIANRIVYTQIEELSK